MPTNKNNIPLLIIGLGGTGSDMAATIKRTFQDRFELAPGSDVPPRTKFMIFDTDIKEQEKQGWSDNEFIHLKGVFHKDALESWESDWFDPEFSDPFGLYKGDGAGVFRQVSRVFLFRNVAAVLQKIRIAVNQLVALNAASLAANPNNKPRIYVLAGISGGTGSGLFLDLAYIIRHSFGNNNNAYELNCMLVMPDVTLQHHGLGNTILEDLYQTNGYAALKELDFWMNYGVHHHQFRQKYDYDTIIEWKGHPYQFVYLFSSKNADGNVITNAYAHVMQVVSEFMVSNFSETQSVVEVRKDKDKNGSDSVITQALQAGTSIASQVSNYAAQYNQIRKEFPTPYIYSSIGAFSNTGDETDILNRESQLILTETVESIDAEQHKPVMEGNDKQLVLDLLNKKLGQVSGSKSPKASRTYTEFEHRNQLKNYLKFTKSITPSSLLLLDYANAPHGSSFNSFKETMEGRLANEKIEISKSMHEEVNEWLTDIISDYEKGPYYAYTMIQHPTQGLLHQLEAETKTMKNDLENSEDIINKNSGSSGKCQKTLEEAKHRNLWLKGLQLILGQDKDQYVQQAKELYTEQWKALYYKAWLASVDELRTYIEKCAALLGDIISGIRKQKNQYDQKVNQHQKAEGIRLLDSDKVQKMLTAQFRDQQMNIRLVKQAYQGIAEAIIRDAAKGIDDYSDNQISDMINTTVDDLRSNVFSQVNVQDVQQRLIAYAIDADANMQTYTKDKLMPTLDRGACPMISISNGTKEIKPGRDVIANYYGTIPAHATDIMKGIHGFINDMEGTSNANVSMSPIKDRIFWIRTLFGIPMNYLTQLKEYAKAYESTNHRSYHLCMSKAGGKSAGLTNIYCQDWAALPEPTCPRNRAMTNREKEVDKLIDDGMINISVELKLDSSNGTDYIPDFNATWTRLNHIEEETNRISMEQVDRAIDKMDSMRDSDKVNFCQKMLENKQIISLECDDVIAKTDAWKNIYKEELDHHASEPDTNSTEQYKAQYLSVTKMAYRRVIVELVSRRPQLLEEIKTNQACIAKLEKSLELYKRPNYDQLGLYGANFAQMYRFGLLTYTNAIARFCIPEVDSKLQIFADLMNAEQMLKLKKNWFPGVSGDAENEKDGYTALLYYIAVYVSQVANSEAESIGLMDKEARKLLEKMKQDMNGHALNGTRPENISELQERNTELQSSIRAEKTSLASKWLKNELQKEEKELLEHVLKGILEDCANFERAWGKQ